MDHVATHTRVCPSIIISPGNCCSDQNVSALHPVAFPYAHFCMEWSLSPQLLALMALAPLLLSPFTPLPTTSEDFPQLPYTPTEALFSPGPFRVQGTCRPPVPCRVEAVVRVSIILHSLVQPYTLFQALYLRHLICC